MSSDEGLFIALYTDEDVSSRLAPALRQRGFNALSTAEADNLRRNDERQLAYATAQNMAILTCNAKDFIPLSKRWAAAGREHAGIIIALQHNRDHFRDLLRRVLSLMDNMTADEIRNQVMYLPLRK
jgi:hypothetical protein